MILTGGYNVLRPRSSASCRGVALAAVGGVVDDRMDEVAKAYVVKKADATIDEGTVVAHCRLHLSPCKVPRHVAFVDDLPKTSTGTILQRDLDKVDA